MTNIPQKPPNKPYLYICELCNLKTNNKKDYSKHLLTRKHINNDRWLQNDADNIPIVSSVFMCKCGKIYKYRQGLYVHKKRCDVIINVNSKHYNESNELKDLVIELMYQNTDIKNNIIKENVKLQKENLKLQKQMIDVCKNIQPNITNSNNNNKTFNLQFFFK